MAINGDKRWRRSISAMAYVATFPLFTALRYGNVVRRESVVVVDAAAIRYNSSCFCVIAVALLLATRISFVEDIDVVHTPYIRLTCCSHYTLSNSHSGGVLPYRVLRRVLVTVLILSAILHC